MQNLSRSVLLAGALVALLAGACGGKNKKQETKLMKSEDSAVLPKVDPTLCEIKGKRIETSDLDRDNRPDIWRLYMTIKEGETTVEFLSCRQTDYDHDGKKDHVVGFDKKGAKTFERFDFDFDGRFDAWFQYDPKTGKLFEVQRETGFDGQVDVVEVYDEKEQLKAVKHDRNGDGEPDMWEQFANGELVAILYDNDYDGKVDVREENKARGPKKPSAENATASSGEAPADDESKDDETGPSDDGAANKDGGKGSEKKPEDR